MSKIYLGIVAFIDKVKELNPWYDSCTGDVLSLLRKTDARLAKVKERKVAAMDSAAVAVAALQKRSQEAMEDIEENARIASNIRKNIFGE